MLTALLLPILVQAAPLVDDDRLRLCVTTAAEDAAAAVLTADTWLAESRGAGRSRPLQCLATAYVSLLRWQAAEQAFAEAATLEPDPARLSALYTQSGNAALAGGAPDRALLHLDNALAVAGNAPETRGAVQADRARALVLLDRTDEARVALTAAQRGAPQAPLVWLLSATFERRQGDLAAAQRMIEVAAALDHDDPEIGLEAGVIAMLGGNPTAARKSWDSVIAAAPASASATTARGYLAQLDEPAP